MELFTWESASFRVADFIEITDDVTFTIQASDFNPGHIVEAAIDGFIVGENIVNTDNLLKNVKIEAFPNPFGETLTFNYELDNGDAILQINNILGQEIETFQLDNNTGSLQFGKNWLAGVYFAKITQDGKTSEVVKIIKQ